MRVKRAAGLQQAADANSQNSQWYDGAVGGAAAAQSAAWVAAGQRDEHPQPESTTRPQAWQPPLHSSLYLAAWGASTAGNNRS